MKSPLALPVTICLAALCLTAQAKSQTIDLKSSTLTVLTAAERDHFLTAHNTARAKVGVAPVRWSDDLSQHALESLRQQQDALIDAAKEGWKDALAVLPEHTVDSNYGENIAGWFGTKARSAEYAVELWLGEKTAFDKLNADGGYHVGDEQDQIETDDSGNERPIVVGHYTAIVWKATTHIGAAKLTFELVDDQKNTRRYSAIICNYNPSGNRLGQKPY
jgi:pathogenesis-related protein 1